MKKQIIFGLSIVLPLALLIYFVVPKEESNKPNKGDNTASGNKRRTSGTLSLFFVGDLMGHETMLNSAKSADGKSYNFEPWFSYLSPKLGAFDMTMLNLEVTLGGPPYSGYPMFCSPDVYAETAHKAGFDFFITANNHSLDRRKKGLERTIDQLDLMKIEHTGTFKNQMDRDNSYPYIKVIKDQRLAILNYTYGTNGLEVELPNIVNMIDTVQMLKDLKKAKEKNSDFTLVTIHWGNEYQRNYSPEQKKLAQWLCDHGADAIIGMHPHVVQPMEILHPKNNPSKAVPVAFSLGNFISAQRDRYKSGGIGLGLTLNISDKGLSFGSWEYLPMWVRKGGNPNGFYVIPGSDWEKNPERYALNAQEESLIKEFLSDTRGLLSKLVEMKF